MLRLDLREWAGEYLTTLMESELTIHLGWKRYEHSQGEANHRKGSFPRKFSMKGLDQVQLKVLRDRQGQFQIKILPRSYQYKDTVAQDLSLKFLAGISTRSLSMIPSGC